MQFWFDKYEGILSFSKTVDDVTVMLGEHNRMLTSENEIPVKIQSWILVRIIGLISFVVCRCLFHFTKEVK